MVKSYFLEFEQERKVKILSARILASTKNVEILFARILTRKKSENPFCLNFARTKNSRILFARILAR
jgi:hypothetical protein